MCPEYGPKKSLSGRSIHTGIHGWLERLPIRLGSPILLRCVSCIDVFEVEFCAGDRNVQEVRLLTKSLLALCVGTRDKGLIQKPHGVPLETFGLVNGGEGNAIIQNLFYRHGDFVEVHRTICEY